MIFSKRKKHRKKLIHNLKITPPKANSFQKELAIVTRTLNDEAYFQEWVDFHIKAGVQHFFVYLDGDFAATKALYEALVPEGTCTFIPWNFDVFDAKTEDRIHPQTTAFAHAILNFGPAYRRFAFIDVDEFILPKGHSTIIDALKATNNHPNVSLPWHMFDFNGHITPPDAGVIRSYTRRTKSLLPNDTSKAQFKCIVHPCKVTHVSVHSFETQSFNDLTSNTSGFVTRNKHRNTSDFLISNNLQLNHYFTRSKQEFENKIRRGAYSTVNDSINDIELQQRSQEIKSEFDMDSYIDMAAVDYYYKK